MYYPNELCQLVIRNMEVIETAPAVVEVTEKRLFQAINARIEEAVNAQKGWRGCYNFATDREDGETVFAPNGWWPKNEEQASYGAYYTLSYTEESEEYAYLACATGVKGSALCFAFELNPAWSNWNAREYRGQLANFYAGNSALQKANFSLAPNGKSIVRSFSFAADTLADEYPDFDAALDPLDAALKDLFKAHDEFNKFVSECSTS